MPRLTERDEFGNADIIGVCMEDLVICLGFEELNLVTAALNKLADYETAEEMAAEEQEMPVIAKWENGPDEYPYCTFCEYRPPYDPLIDDIFYSHYCPNCGKEMEGT